MTLLIGCTKDRLTKEYDQNAVLEDHVIVLDSNIFKLISDSSDLADNIYKINCSSCKGDEIQTGKIILGYQKEGFLKHIHSTHFENNVFYLNTSQATIEESFKKLSFSKKLFDELDVNAKTNNNYTFEIDLPNAFLLQGNELTWLQIKNGSLKFDLNATFDIDLDDNQINYLNFGTQGSSIELDYDVFAAANINIPGLNPPAKNLHKPIKKISVMWAGPVPIVTVSEFVLQARLSGYIYPMSLDFNINLKRSFSAGIKYENKSFDPYFDYESENNFQDFHFSPQLYTNIYLRLVPVINTKIFGVTGPYIEPTLSADLEAGFNYATSDFDLEFSVKTFLRTGIKAKIFNFIDQNYFYQFNGSKKSICKLPAMIEIEGGQNQSANHSSTLDQPIKIKVTDSYGNPLPSVNTYFSVLGGGSLTNTTQKTNLLGNAQTNWTLGQSGAQSILVEIKDSYGQTIDSKTIHASILTDNAPNCSDGIQNGNETGIDCGGDCIPCPDVNSTIYTAQIYNMDGTGVAGAWDCLMHQEMFLNDPDIQKDLANTTPIGVNDNAFELELESLNGSTYSQISLSEFNSVTNHTSATSLYSQKQNTASSIISNLQVQQHFIGRLRNQETYIVFTIQSIEHTANDDFDYFTISYQTFN